MAPYAVAALQASIHASTSRQQAASRQALVTNGNYRPNVIMSDNSKKSYNYMASPNYLQYENTYQKFKNLCHNKDVSNFQDVAVLGQHDHGAAGHYRNHVDDLVMDELVMDGRYVSGETKTENMMQSSDDEGGFRNNMKYLKNQFNHQNSTNSCNAPNGNGGYNTREIEPLLREMNHQEPIQHLLRVSTFFSGQI